MIRPAPAAARQALREAGVRTPDLDLRRLADGASDDVLVARIARRIAGEPVARILGRRGFWTLDLCVTPDVLDPRPDTETVVEAALAEQATRGTPGAGFRVLDLGTGSGALLLALLSEWPAATGVGIDLSPKALAVAARNADAHGLGDRARFEVADFGAYDRGRFDVVVANPPYIPTADLAGLAPEVRDHDPAMALDGGADGLAAYGRIVARLPLLMTDAGFAVLELGQGQKAAVSRLANAAGLSIRAIRNDLAGIARALVIAR